VIGLLIGLSIIVINTVLALLLSLTKKTDPGDKMSTGILL
jgi:hypothetical protein